MSINIDNQDSIVMSHRGCPTLRTGHLDLTQCYLVAEVYPMRLSTVYIPAAQQKADFVTKRLSKPMWVAKIALMH